MIVVATCERVDLIAHFGEAFAREAPGIKLMAPDQVTDPAAVRYVLTFEPADDAFAPYPNLEAVFSIAAGIDKILNCPSLPDVPVHRVEDPDQAMQMAGFAAFHVLWHHRRMDLQLASEARGEWVQHCDDPSPSARRVGVMGFGLMGRSVARGLRDLGYSVAALARSRPEDQGIEGFTTQEQSQFLARTDILINVLPLTAATTGVLDADLFAALPRGAALIHIGRGPQLVEGALMAALDSGQIAGASLDVFDHEPLARDHPFWSHPAVLVTPHMASLAGRGAVVRTVLSGVAEGSGE